MANLQIRQNISYQADYLDLRGLNKDSNKILKDLTNIQSLTNVVGSSHLTVLINPDTDVRTNFANTIYDLIFSLVGIPWGLWSRSCGKIANTRKQFDISVLSAKWQETLQQVVGEVKLKKSNTIVPTIQLTNNLPNKRTLSSLRAELNKNKGDNSHEITGVIFMHTLVYDSEIPCLVNYLFSSIDNSNMSDSVLSGYRANTTDYNRLTRDVRSLIFTNYGDDAYTIPRKTTDQVEAFKDEVFIPKAFTLMIPVYSSYDIIKQSKDMFSKETRLKESSFLNWTLPVQVKRYRSEFIDPFTSEDTTDSVVIRFTYFPPEINDSYYNKYVEAMTSTQQINFIKTPFLKSSFAVIENKSVKTLWKKLNSFFSFMIFPENLINIMGLTCLSGTFGRTFSNNNVNYIDDMINIGSMYSSKALFVTHFLHDNDFTKNLIKIVRSDFPETSDPEKTFKEAIDTLLLGITETNNSCEEAGINPIISDSLKNTFLYYMHYWFLTSLLEKSCSVRHRMQYKLCGTSVSNYKDRILLEIGTYRTGYSLKMQRQLKAIIDSNSTDEAVEIYKKAKEFYMDYIRANFLVFLTIDKDFKGIVESYQLGRKSPYLEEQYSVDKNATFVELKNIFFEYDFNRRTGSIGSIRDKFHRFIEGQINKKYETLSNKKRLPELRLFDTILLDYKGDLFRNIIINKRITEEKDDSSTIFHLFTSKAFNKRLSEKLSHLEHVRRIATDLETNFKFSRII